jgi:hypothetical protein
MTAHFPGLVYIHFNTWPPTFLARYIHFNTWSLTFLANLYAMGIDFVSFYDFDISFWNYSDSIVFFVFYFYHIMIKLSEEFIVDSWSIPINLIKIRLKTKFYGDTLKSNKIHSGHVIKNQGWTQVLSTGKQFPYTGQVKPAKVIYNSRKLIAFFLLRRLGSEV